MPAGRESSKHPDDSVTEVLPVLDYGALHELPIRHAAAFDADVQVLTSDELDDTSAADDLVALLLLPTEPGVATPTGSGRHRRSPERTPHRPGLVVSACAGALAMAALAAEIPHVTLFGSTASAAGTTPAIAAPVSRSDGIQVVPVTPTADTGEHRREIAVATAFAIERATREARMYRPLVLAPTRGVATSAFGSRWGTLHGGIDVANAIGTPIYAAADGVVIAAGPTAGYGMWVKVRHADGTVTLYGHIDTTTVSVGDEVLAGDQVATMGNRGNSTGPHLHFEVLRNGAERVDPIAWLQSAGADASPLGF